MAKPGSDRDGTMVEKQTGKKTPKLDRGELLEVKPKSSMKRKLTFSLSPQRNEERDSDTDSDPGHSSETWGERFSPPCRIYTDKDGPEKKKVKKETGSKKSTPVNILFGYPLSERKQMALLMQMTARDNSPDSTPSHPTQAAPVQKKISSSTTSRQKDKINKRNERGETALHLAAIRGDVKQVEELISLGADANVKDFAGWTPLHEACNLGHYDVAKVLISTGAEVNTQGLDDDTPLHDASSSGHKDIVRLLLQHGGNPLQANDRGERPVDVADSKDIEELLKGEAQISNSDESSSDSEGHSSTDDDMEYSDTEKDTKQTCATNKSASTARLDEYEFQDEEEEGLSNAPKDRPLLKRKSRRRQKDAIERNHFVDSQERSESTRTCKSKKQKISRIQYHSPVSSSDETSPERKSSSTCPLTIDIHKAELRTKKLNLSVEIKEKGKANMNKNLNKNKENQELKEDRKENCKVPLLSTTVPGLETPENTREEDSFKMSFSPKDEDSVHLFPLLTIKSPKHNHSDKQSGPLKQENLKLFMPSEDSPCQMDSVKHNYHVEPYNTESSSSKILKHKDKSKYHHQDLSCEGEGENLDNGEVALQKTDKEGKVIKKHKLKHQEKEKNKKENDNEKVKNKKDSDNEKDTDRKENETERVKHRQRDARKDSHRHQFDRAFWKENFFKSYENEDLQSEKDEEPENISLQKGTDLPLVRTTKEKHFHSKDKKQKEGAKDKDFKKEKEELQCREGKGNDLKTAEETANCHISNWGPVDSDVKEEMEDNPISENKLQDQTEKGAQEKTEKRLPGREKESETLDKKYSDREKKLKTEYLWDKSELHNCTDKLKEKEKVMSGSSYFPLEKNQKESEKSKAALLTKKPEDKKIKEKVDRKNEKEKQEKVRCPTESRDKERNSIDKKGKTSEKVAVADQCKLDRVKEKEKDNEKKKKDKIKDISSSSSNLKTFLVEKRSSVCENSKTPTDKTKPLEKDKRTKDKHADRHRDGCKDKSQQTKTNKIKMNEAEADGGKSKPSPAPKDARPKEKRLVNDDLMQTSFERMLSLKDQEIEQWHRKHKEKIKQKERERMKHQPVAEHSKLKNKDRVKNSPGEPCLSKDFLRSKSSDVSEAHSQENMLKETTSTRSVSLDTKSIAHIGKMESDETGLICRSVSMISVTSSEDSSQTAVLTPRPQTEHDSGFDKEGLDSQLCTIPTSSAVQDVDCDCFLDGVPQKSTTLSNKQETPWSTVDEDGKPASTDGRPNELSWSGALSSKEHSKNCLPVSSQESQLPNLSNCSTETPTDTGNEGTHLSPHVLLDVGLVPEPVSRVSLLKDSDKSDGEHVSVSQADTSLWTVTETKEHGVTDFLFEGDVHFPQGEDLRTKTNLVEKSTSEHVIFEIKESLPVDTIGIGSLPLSQQHVSSNEKVSDCCGEHQDVCSDLSVGLLHRAERDSEQKENPSLLEDTPCVDRKFEDRTMEKQYSDLSEKPRTDCEGSTSLSTTSFNTTINGTVSNTESSSQHEPKGAQENMDTDSVVPKDTKQRLVNESLGASDLQSDCNEFAHSTLSTVVECCQGAKHQLEENTLHEAEESKERNVSLEIAENLSLPVETGPQACTTAELKPETYEEMTAFAAVPEKEIQQLQQDTSDSSFSGLQVDFQSEHSNVPSGRSSPQPEEGHSDSCGDNSKTTLLEEDDIQLPHPRKRKMHQAQSIHTEPFTLHTKETTQQSLAAIVDSLKLEEIEPYQTERANPYYEFLHIRRKIEEKRKILCSVIPQAPQYYDEYVTFNGSYLLDGNPLGKLCIPTITPPPSLPEPLKEMFKQQEVVRMKLRLQHGIEREKLILSNEQEVLRVHYRAARTLANQALPFSACTVLLDAEVYTMPQEVQGDDCKTSVRDRFNARQFMSWLQDVDDKFDKLKTCLLMRQQHEAAALNAVQRLEWQLKLQELDPATYKSVSIFQIPEFYIPLVDVSDDFELAPI
ncbi:ankyrin repeat domain-containing protein 12-like isoform X2 [Conger conger]|uniref:ankyrin repeat domain-containing protein 12-like isoform X2 n=1 Tax=Conger conger TaxID=82655 RepID=UPI002A5A67A3|nr:ankyrin repeat domain-containing protein 12-like isoform X2 [Conger conger]